MKFTVKYLSGSLFVFLLMIVCGCDPEHEHQEEPYIQNIVEPLAHQINDWLSTDWEGDEIVLYITDHSQSVSVRSASDRKIEVGTEDCFISIYNISGTTSVSTNSSSFYQYNGKIAPIHVGKTSLRIREKDSNFELFIPVTILPEYYTYREPGLDFNDTRESVVLKLSSLQYTENDGVFYVTDPHNDYSLTVNYSANGTVDSYEVTLDNSVSSDELTGYVSERYYKTSGYFNGLPVYIKAFNVSLPSISDATIVVILDAEDRKITYKNPLTYSK